ncbi:hypothetical protein QBC39DRAFT_420218 [Podospora conica]|nr:hypothetical protein QBC39DRAFT_420218 [Schizothecium conicum]
MMHGGGALTTAAVGARVLGEVEEMSIDEFLASLRTGFPPSSSSSNPHADDPPPTFDLTTATTTPRKKKPKTFPFPPLDDLVARHHRATGSAPLALAGPAALDLVYLVVATLLAPPWKMAVSVVDLDGGRFDVLRLLAEGATDCRREDLEHLYVVRPPPGCAVGECVAAVEEHMLYGEHGSRRREWWGSVVVGGGGRGKVEGESVAVVVGDWGGWMRVERREVGGFGEASVEEALEGRKRREGEVEAAGWVGMSAWGGFWFGGRGGG